MSKISNVSINARIFLSALVPLAMLLFVGTFSATEHYVSYASLDRLQQLSEAAPKLSSIVHDLQRERGYSAGFIATKGGATWRTNLDAQYAKTDETLENTLSDLRTFPAAEFGAGFAASLTQAINLIEQLADQRQRAQSLSVPVSVIAGYYTSANRQLLDALSAIADQVEASLSERVTTLSSASTELSKTANNMSGLAEATNNESTKVSEVSDHATQNVESVASASSQLSSAMSEVTEQITVASNLTVESQATSEETEEQMKTLADAADRIGSVMSLIQEIAVQVSSAADELSTTSEQLRTVVADLIQSIRAA